MLRLAILLIWFFIVLSMGLKQSSEICKTSACISISDQISQLMDLKIDPCLDFNKFACGGFENEAVLEGSLDAKKTINMPIENLRTRIKKLVQIPETRLNDFNTDQKVKDFYKACKSFFNVLDKKSYYTDWTGYMSGLLSPSIIDTLNKVGLSGWPYQNNSQLKPNFMWFDIVPKLIMEGIVYADGVLELPIINVEVGVNDFSRDIYTIKLDAPDFDIDHKNDAKTLHTIDNTEYKYNIDLETILDILGPSQQLPNQKMLARSLEIDHALYDITTLTKFDPDKILKDKLYRDYGRHNILEENLVSKLGYQLIEMAGLPRLTCGTTEIRCIAPTWVEYFASLFRASGNPNIDINLNQNIVVKDWNYLIKLDKTLQNLKIEPFEMANYLGWKIVSDLFIAAKNLELEFQGNCLNYLIKGRSARRRSELGLLNTAVGSMYIREYFNPEWKSEVEEMVSYVRMVTQLLLQKIPWMTTESKRKASEKLQSMKAFIAYPDELLSKSIIDEYYKDLSVSNGNNPSDDHPRNIKGIAKFLIKKSFAKMGTKWNSSSWDLDFHQIVNTVNAHYLPLFNEFILAAGFLQDFNYAHDHPMYLNFAITGYTIGHEILHGFDNVGKLYGKNGEYLGETGWWSKHTDVEWKKRAECLEDRYSKIKVNYQNETFSQHSQHNHINGSNTLGENIADIGGIRMAYYAYSEWTKKYGKDELLPGISFSANQLFWIRSAQLHCARFGDKHLENQVANDHHVPGGYRTNGHLTFSKEFAKDFNCKKGTLMNPNSTCQIEYLGLEDPLQSNQLNHGSSTFFVPPRLFLMLVLSIHFVSAQLISNN